MLSMILCFSLYQHTIRTTNPLRMPEKLRLQWSDFKENVNSAFGKLRDDKEFTDVTLVCEDGQQMEAHKVIMASLSPFFQKILQKSKHTHTLSSTWEGFSQKILLRFLTSSILGRQMCTKRTWILSLLLLKRSS